jgi:hypothetical protein
MMGCRSKAIRVCMCGDELWISGVSALEDEPKADNSSPEFGDGTRKTAVGRNSLLAQSFVASKFFGAPSVCALKDVGDGNPEQGSGDGDCAG